MNRITIGKFIDKKTWLHNIDPRLKLIANILLLISLFSLRSIILLGIFDAIIIIGFFTLNIGCKQLVSILKWVLPITIVQFLFQAYMFPPGDHVFFTSLHFKIGDLTIKQPGRTMLRIYTMFLLASMYSSTTRPLDVTKSIEDLLWPLKKIKIPIHIIAMVISIALQFGPSMIEHGRKVAQAQSARGYDIKHVSWSKKLSNVKVIWIPMLAAAFNNALQLGSAMDARAYNPYTPKSSLIKYKINLASLLLTTFALGITIFAFLYTKEIKTFPYWWT